MKAEIISETEVFQGFLRLIEAQVSFQKFDGTMSPPVTRLTLERGDSVAVVLVTPTGDLVLTRQFRYPTLKKGPGWLIEIPAGSLDHPGEDPELAIRREIEEETGYQCGSLTLLTVFYPSPGGSTERIHLYMAISTGQPGKGGGVPAEDEDIQTLTTPITKALRQVMTGEIVDGKTIIAVLFLAVQLQLPLPDTSPGPLVPRKKR